jgi:hypothetical protein
MLNTIVRPTGDGRFDNFQCGRQECELVLVEAFIGS